MLKSKVLYCCNYIFNVISMFDFQSRSGSILRLLKNRLALLQKEIWAPLIRFHSFMGMIYIEFHPSMEVRIPWSMICLGSLKEPNDRFSTRNLCWNLNQGCTEKLFDFNRNETKTNDIIVVAGDADDDVEGLPIAPEIYLYLFRA